MGPQSRLRLGGQLQQPQLALSVGSLGEVRAVRLLLQLRPQLLDQDGLQVQRQQRSGMPAMSASAAVPALVRLPLPLRLRLLQHVQPQFIIMTAPVTAKMELQLRSRVSKAQAAQLLQASPQQRLRVVAAWLLVAVMRARALTSQP